MIRYCKCIHKKTSLLCIVYIYIDVFEESLDSFPLMHPYASMFHWVILARPCFHWVSGVRRVWEAVTAPMISSVATQSGNRSHGRIQVDFLRTWFELAGFKPLSMSWNYNYFRGYSCSTSHGNQRKMAKWPKLDMKQSSWSNPFSTEASREQSWEI